MNEITQRIYDRIVRDLNTLGCDFIVVTPEGHMDSQGSLQLQTEEVAPKIITKTVEVPTATPQFFYDMMATAADVMAFVCNGSSNQDFVRRKAAAWLQAHKDYFVGPAPARAKLVAPGSHKPMPAPKNGRGPARGPRINWSEHNVDFDLVKAMEPGDTLVYDYINGVPIDRLSSRLSMIGIATFGTGNFQTLRDSTNRKFTVRRLK